MSDPARRPCGAPFRLALLPWFVVLTACPSSPWNRDCGLPGSKGNSQGVGAYCTRDSECFEVPTQLPELHCSTVLVDARLPNLCSSVCEPGKTDCGPDAECRSITPLGYDLVVCVPTACREDFPAVFEPAP